MTGTDPAILKAGLISGAEFILGVDPKEKDSSTLHEETREWFLQLLATQPGEDLEERLRAAKTLIESVAYRKPVPLSDRVHAASLAGEIVAALACAMTSQGIESAHDLQVMVFAMNRTVPGISWLYEAMAEAAEKQPELFTKPRTGLYATHRRSPVPPEVHARRREATLEEATVFAREAAEDLRGVSNAMAGLDRLHGYQVGQYYGPDHRFVQPGTYLYRWFDGDGLLLYVGITENLKTRDKAHAKKSDWMQFAVDQTTEFFVDRMDAEFEERRVIELENPLFNDARSDPASARQRLVEYLVGKGRLDLLRPNVSRG